MRLLSILSLTSLLLATRTFADDTKIADAAERRRVDVMRQLIEAKADVNGVQVDGMTALHWTAYHDDAAATKILLQAGAKATIANRYGITALSLACVNGNDEIVKLLLDVDADANATLQGGETPLMTASRTGKLAPVELLLDNGAAVNKREKKGQTALMWGAAEGHADVVKALLDAKADRTVQLKSGFTAWFFAVRQGHAGVVRTLLDAGEDVNQVMGPERPGGKAPRRGTSALMLAVENGHFELALELVRAGADPNDQRSGYTPLHALTWVRKPNRGDGPDGDPPPRGTGLVTSLQFIRKLVAAGADVNVQLKRGKSGRGRLNETGATPFLLAAKTADLPMMKLLLELHADPHITNADKSTALMATAGLGTLAPDEVAGTEAEALAATELLLDLKFDVNTVDANGETAMHGAAYKSLPKVAKALDAAGAKIEIWNRKNKFGWTPVLIAEGHRPGNFKPSFETLEALHTIMQKHGVTPPPPTPRKIRKRYDQP